MMTEADGETATLFPKSARLRNLTYSAPLYVDVSYRVMKKGHDCEEVTETMEYPKVFIGKVVINISGYFALLCSFLSNCFFSCRFLSCCVLVIAHCFNSPKRILQNLESALMTKEGIL